METGILLDMYRDMVRIRKFECKIVDDCFPKGMLYGNFHTCIGQEGAVVGACYALEERDCLTTTHRGHGHCVAKGMDTSRMMAEMAVMERTKAVTSPLRKESLISGNVTVINTLKLSAPMS